MQRLAFAMARTITLFVLVVALNVLGTGAARAGLAPDGQLPIGGWCGPAASSMTDAAGAETQMSRLAAAGFNVVMHPCDPLVSWWDVATTRRALAAAGNHGLKVIVNDVRLDNAFRTGTTAQLDDVIADYSSYPALGGYVPMDEPRPDQFAALATVVRYLRDHDPAHPVFTNVYPNYVTGLGRPYPEYLDEYLETIQPTVLSYDNYRTSLFYPVNGTPQTFFANLVTARDAARAHGVPFWQVVLATEHTAVVGAPTAAQKLWEGMQTLAYGGKGVIFLTYWTPADPSYREAMIARDGVPTSRYYEMPAVNARLQTIGRELLSTDHRYTFQTGPVADGGITRPAGAPARVTGSVPTTVGIFDKSGYVYTLVANRDGTNAIRTTTQISYGASLPERLSASGTWSTPTPNATGGSSLASYTTDLAAGDAVLYRVRTPLPLNDEVLFGRVRDNVGNLYSVDSYGGVSHIGLAGWGQCPDGYRYVARNEWTNGFWLCARADLASRGFYAGNVINNYALFYRAQSGNMLPHGRGQAWNSCPATSRLIGASVEPNGFWVCIDAAGRLGPEAVFGRVRNNVGEWDVVDSANGVVISDGAGWGYCPEGYGYVGKHEWSSGFFLCARADLIPRLFYAGNVVSNNGTYYSVQWGAVSMLGAGGWNQCNGSSRLIGRLETPDGFWLCMQ
ncbi:hypothetical protein VSS74_30350 [Conexibacter stalactiti]|uniref:Glycoside hydrolase family 42 N-terminal domain-containing protein n=1 Tax=Conexibacter stalactiti TaxID=1940611 RepID=A0ABU4I199_9ACTN|nr:hypothetical protein [Conexibacter stalactiti]MDW5598702.1 hypothetical protein [Conexibacter stalactiti]MEC5039344.1 hypothetical protein [Conexibacter stalactiti]